MAVWGTASPWGITSWSSGGVIASIPGTISTTGIDAQNQALGVDIFFNGDYEISAAGALQIVRGLAAFNQAMYTRLITKPGSFAYRPGYGIGIQRWAKRRNLISDMHELEQVTIDQLSLDKRVKQVKNVFVSPLLNAPGVQLGFDIKAFGGEISFRPLIFTPDGVQRA